MLTPSEIRDKTYKGGLGYDKKEVEHFNQEIANDYEKLLIENENLNKKVTDLTDSISYYKSIEKTLQKALVIAEKTAQDIKNNANKEADVIVLDAKANAKMIESGALKKSEMLEHKTLNLLKQYDLFKAHFKNLLNAQLELLASSSFSINTLDFSYGDDKAKHTEFTRIGDVKEKNSIDTSIDQQDEEHNTKLKTENQASLVNENAFEFIDIEGDDL